MSNLLLFALQGRYRRIDRFQEDMFKVFEHARRLSRTDSQVSFTCNLFPLHWQVTVALRLNSLHCIYGS